MANLPIKNGVEPRNGNYSGGCKAMCRTLLEGVWLNEIGRKAEVRNVPHLAWCECRVYSLESNCSIIEKIPPKGESFSDFIATFAMSVGFDTYFALQH